MTSIRTYEGEIGICTSCGQPAFPADTGNDAEEWWLHFVEQWDGVHCNRFPVAAKVVRVRWDFKSLLDLKRRYPDLRPSRRTRSPHVG